MPAYLHDSRDVAIKIVSIYPENPNLGLPTIAATVLVLDPQTGLPLAFMEGTSLTAVRTGATGGLAADLLAREDADTVALFGAGVQARTQLQAVLTVRSIRQVNLFDISETAAASWRMKLPPGRILPQSTSFRAQQKRSKRLTLSSPQRPLKSLYLTATISKRAPMLPALVHFSPDVREIDEATVRQARLWSTSVKLLGRSRRSDHT